MKKLTILFFVLNCLVLVYCASILGKFIKSVTPDWNKKNLILFLRVTVSHVDE